MKSDFEKYVSEANELITYVLSSHLLIEHYLIQWLTYVLPKPEALFKRSNIRFSLLINLCEAHKLFDTDIASILKKINSIRNKYAHRLSNNATTKEIKELLELLKQMKNAFYMSYVPPNEQEMIYALSAFCGFIERSVKEYKNLTSQFYVASMIMW